MAPAIATATAIAGDIPSSACDEIMTAINDLRRLPSLPGHAQAANVTAAPAVASMAVAASAAASIGGQSAKAFGREEHWSSYTAARAGKDGMTWHCHQQAPPLSRFTLQGAQPGEASTLQEASACGGNQRDPMADTCAPASSTAHMTSLSGMGGRQREQQQGVRPSWETAFLASSQRHMGVGLKEEGHVLTLEEQLDVLARSIPASSSAAAVTSVVGATPSVAAEASPWQGRWQQSRVQQREQLLPAADSFMPAGTAQAIASTPTAPDALPGLFSGSRPSLTPHSSAADPNPLMLPLGAVVQPCLPACPTAGCSADNAAAAAASIARERQRQGRTVGAVELAELHKESASLVAGSKQVVAREQGQQRSGRSSSQETVQKISSGTMTPAAVDAELDSSEWGGGRKAEMGEQGGASLPTSVELLQQLTLEDFMSGSKDAQASYVNNNPVEESGVEELNLDLAL